MSLLQNSNAIEAGGYPISNSLRFQSASSQYLSRTPASAGNRKTWTWSAWVKPSLSVSTYAMLFSAGSSNGASTRNYFGFDSSYRFIFGYGTADYRVSTQVFRDPSSWYHIVVVFDSSNATAQNRIRVYVNNVEITVWTTNNTVTLNQDGAINNNILHYNGAESGGYYLNGYMTEVNFIDGQALTPSSFGETNTLTGQWVAKKYTGTYGTNGFYLPFSNGTSTTTLGNDSSGNGNNWTLTNFTRSAGVSDCWMYDVPSGNGGVAGTQPNSNYAVINPLNLASSGVTSTNANLLATSTGAAYRSLTSTIDLPTGSWYFEITAGTNSAGDNVMVGIQSVTENLQSNYVGSSATSYGYGSGGKKYNAGTGVAYGATWTAGDVIGIAFNGSTLTFYKNNTSQGNAYTGLSGNFVFVVSAYNSSASVNFGQRSFAYTPPSGFKALCTANLPASTIVKGNKYMDATLYTGDNTNNRSITNAASFRPDFVWIKDRTAANYHILFDSVRGGNALFSNDTLAEVNMSSTYGWTNTAPTTTGFKVDKGTNGAINNSTDAYVAWQWQAGQGTTSSNTNGSITSTVSVNATAGFSIVTYTGTGANATVGHGLGVAPKMVIVKLRSASGGQWFTYHESIGNTKYLMLNTTDATTTSATAWNNTSPTSSVFTIGTNGNVNQAQNFVAYCFAEIAGFSKFGSYTGNGSTDGPFVYCGFRPKFVMIKNTTTASTNWLTWDSTTNSYNVANLYLIPNSSVAEQTTGADIDVLSNGFKVRNTSGAGNTSSATIIFAAFAENPFQNSNAR